MDPAGEVDPQTTRIIHLRRNPLSEALAQRKANQQSSTSTASAASVSLSSAAQSSDTVGRKEVSGRSALARSASAGLSYSASAGGVRSSSDETSRHKSNRNNADAATIRKLEARCLELQKSRDKLSEAIEAQLRQQYTSLRGLFGFQLTFEDEPHSGGCGLVTLRPESHPQMKVVFRTQPEGHVDALTPATSPDVLTEEALARVEEEDIPGFLFTILQQLKEPID